MTKFDLLQEILAKQASIPTRQSQVLTESIDASPVGKSAYLREELDSPYGRASGAPVSFLPLRFCYANGMKLVQVIPIVRGGAKEELTYFSTQETPLGSIVSIPLRKKNVRALVVRNDDVEEAKLTLKRSDWSVRKLGRQKPLSLLSPAFITAVKKIAEYHARNVGAVLYTLVPKAVLETPKELGAMRSAEEKESPPTTKNQNLAFQAPYDERCETYRSLIREEFARGASIAIIVPTIVAGEQIFGRLSRGILEYTFLFHSGLSAKELQQRWADALLTEHPVLIISTAPFLSLPRHDLGTIIVENENSSAYKTVATPSLDLRFVAEALAKVIHARCIFADFPLSVETLWRFREHELDELSPLKLRPQFASASVIADMRAIEKKSDGTQALPAVSEKFRVLGEEMRSLIEEAVRKEKRLFLFGARRGIAPITVCQDCNSTVVCAACGAPVALHKMTNGKALGENMFVCHRCKAVRSAKERCAVCRSWRLISLGIGIERVLEELKALYPHLSPLRMDRDSVTTHRQAKIIMETFYRNPGQVLVGTEMAIHYLSEPIPFSGITSIDSLLSLPEWRISEKVFSLIIALRRLTAEALVIQTRRPNDYIVRTAVAGSIADFYATELKLREEFKYPPAVTLIRISCRAPRTRALADFEKIKALLSPHALEFFETRSSGRVSDGRGIKFGNTVHGLLRVPRGLWPDAALSKHLSALPPYFTVSVNPDALFQ